MQRRRFLNSAVALGAAPPLFVARTAAAAPPGPDQRVLVVLELAGGNDGLNTVVPYARDEYRKGRPGLRIGADDALKLVDGMGLHPRMTGMKKLWDDGLLSIVQGVGYPNPNRSHFRSMDIWHTGIADREDTGAGWLGRALDANAKRFEGATPAVALGADRLPLALLARTVAVPSLRNVEQYQLGLGEATRAGARRQAMAALLDGPAADDDLAFVRRTARVAYDTAERLQGVTKSYQPVAPYPDTHVAKMLKTVAQMIAADFGARVYYVSMGGFDTHSQQQAVHATLLGEVSDAVAAFAADLKGHKVADRTALVAFSEFGRRLQENGSLGTDHGAAGPVFFLRPQGASGKGGLIGKLPSLTDLDDGDLKHHTDFRQVYAALLDNWLGLDSVPVLGRKYAPVPLV